MFSSLLIANRGEIACRIIRTARRMGMRTIAVYSLADEGALHVRTADAAVCIGPASARESYLHVDRIIAAARAQGAQAIHPGYGFLSESAHLAQACEQSGICFVGPSAEAIRTMGSKSAAKALLQAAGVPLTPGYHGTNQDATFLATEAGRIGFPVLIKASAGGGGKGMRRVDRAEDFGVALAACQREALASFGSAQVLVEKYLEQPRHIEIQIFADSHGNAVHLFERDCSVQRRHQKVLEEAPAPGLAPGRRAQMGRAALQVARAVGYVGAGTVEFIVPRPAQTHDVAETFYFMEMNTRLQVEHAVTEMIADVDLVEWQLRVAAGEPLPCSQQDLLIRGHAIEARVYAEDAERGFTPASGTIEYLQWPSTSAHVRVDTGIEQGDAISPHYDPMIAKVIAWDTNREGARARLRAALEQTRIVGLTTNVAFLARLVDSPSFAGAMLDTDLIARDASVVQPAAQLPAREFWLLAALAQLEHEALEDARAGRATSPWGVRDSWRMNRRGARSVELLWRGAAGHELRRVTVRTQAGVRALTYEGVTSAGFARFVAPQSEGGRLQAHVDGVAVDATAVRHGRSWHVFVGARHESLELRDALAAAAGAGDDEEHRATLLAPMPGKIIALLVGAGARVERGAPLLILEAMKMEHTVRAPEAGLLRAFRVQVADQVTMGTQLMDFVPEAPADSQEAARG
ncbi:MAG TPA: biotin carboxylase N-terminal domain-containing protein [Burkholderiaceae bacterium]|nr:biotin carboxylase N-terminal domain-containing protein [Burkholderiaceae bacterium]